MSESYSRSSGSAISRARRCSRSRGGRRSLSKSDEPCKRATNPGSEVGETWLAHDRSRCSMTFDSWTAEKPSQGQMWTSMVDSASGSKYGARSAAMRPCSNGTTRTNEARRGKSTLRAWSCERSVQPSRGVTDHRAQREAIIAAEVRVRLEPIARLGRQPLCGSRVAGQKPELQRAFVDQQRERPPIRPG